MAGAFGAVEAEWALQELETLGADVAAAGGDPVTTLAEVLGARHGFQGDREHYDEPRNSMLDVVRRRGRGLPILLSAVYIEAGRHAGIAVDGVGLPGHFVVSVGGRLIDPFNGGRPVEAVVPDAL